MAKKTTLKNRIIVDPNILVGKPVVKGTRISVELVLAKLAHNPDINELFLDYPRLTIEDVKACLDYAKRWWNKKREMIDLKLLLNRTSKLHEVSLG